jgi:hypothetical protein
MKVSRFTAPHRGGFTRDDWFVTIARRSSVTGEARPLDAAGRRFVREHYRFYRRECGHRPDIARMMVIGSCAAGPAFSVVCEVAK